MSESEQVRLQKYIAECGIASRRAAEELIQSGKVYVNGKKITELGTKITPGADRVTVGGRAISVPEKGALIVNKPRHVVSTLSDPEGRPTIAEILDRSTSSYFPVGRLDFESTGLILMTNDGELAERLMHPKFGFKRVYEIKVEGVVERETIQKLESGVNLEDGLAKCRAKITEKLPNATWLEVSVDMGKNRIVRRLFEHVGHEVVKLHRIKHGPVELEGLALGHIRKLTVGEYKKLRKQVLGKAS
jgi:23S rRNA pseudouridine2605 synthase